MAAAAVRRRRLRQRRDQHRAVAREPRGRRGREAARGRALRNRGRGGRPGRRAGRGRGARPPADGAGSAARVRRRRRREAQQLPRGRVDGDAGVDLEPRGDADRAVGREREQRVEPVLEQRLARDGDQQRAAAPREREPERVGVVRVAADCRDVLEQDRHKEIVRARRCMEGQAAGAQAGPAVLPPAGKPVLRPQPDGRVDEDRLGLGHRVTRSAGNQRDRGSMGDVRVRHHRSGGMPSSRSRADEHG
ncbi:hypothetical protein CAUPRSCDRAFT_11979 [Caulochytrium protostelioides]|uniref:Uncharacterized protein n=1 Tax=Caulochytrium protostelioides TaxID=1555241 RepID=A0A4P9WW02_9FUNG|nr:hypothetical protein CAUPRSCDRAFT_11979 [Caulochytrium protostelioides]